MKTKGRITFKTVMIFLGFNLVFAVILAPFIVLWGPFDSLKAVIVGSVYTSRHPQLVQIFLSQSEIDRIMKLNTSQGISGAQAIGRIKVLTNALSGITIEDIQGPSFKGKVMLIKDPKRVKLAITKEIGVTGERVSDLVKDMGAIAGINAGGFYDPNGKGSGAFPDGLTIQNGKMAHNNVGNKVIILPGLMMREN